MSSDLRTDDDALPVLADLLAADRSTSRAPGRSATGEHSLSGDQAYVAVPSFDRLRYLLPANAPAAAAAHLRSGSGMVAGLVAHGLARPAIRVGALRLATRRTLTIPRGDQDHPTLADRLAGALGRRSVALSVAIGPPRPNRKPVIRLSDHRGRAVGWAKVGTSAHAAALVRHEADFLAGPGPGNLRAAGIRTPDLLAQFDWKGYPVAVASALPATVGLRVRTLPLTADVITAIAESDRGHASPARGPVADSAWWKQVEAQVGDLAEPRRDLAAKAAAAVLDRLGAVELRYGRWHGDLASWNAQWHGDRLLVWDWERTDDPVPVGFDAVHGAFQFRLLRDRLPAADARCRATEDATRVLAALEIDHRSAAAVTAGYCLAFALRLLDDARAAALDPAAAAIVEALLCDLAGTGAA